MEPLDDLLIARRRGTLAEDAAPRLRTGLRRSPELALSLAAGEAFDAQSTELAGDAALLEHIASEVEQRWLLRQPPPSHARVRWSIVSLLIGAVAAGAGYRSFASEEAALRARATAPSIAPLGAAQPTAAAEPERSRLEPPSLKAQSTQAQSTQEAPSQLAPRSLALSQSAPSHAAPERTPAAATAEPAPGAGQSRRVSNPYLLAPPTLGRAHAQPARPAEAAVRIASPMEAAQPTGPKASAELAPAESARGRELSARELFEQAGQARAHDWLKAEALYTALLEQYPSSREAGIAEMALAKRALGQGRAAEALRWFVAHQARSGSSLRLEALWGEARALELLGGDAELARAWQRLLREYPGSAYAAVARRRLAR